MFLIPKDSWEVRETKEKGRGVFATEDIQAGTIIGDYIGKVIRPIDEDSHEKDGELYLMYYNDQASVIPYKEKAGIHLINHSCEPTCWMHTYKGHTLFFALRHIFAGEEITVAYLLSPLEPNDKIEEFICKCRCKTCSGNMCLTKERYKEWAAFTEAEEKRTKADKVEFGKDLPFLNDYPNNIADNEIYNLFGNPNVEPLVLENEELPNAFEVRKLIRESGRTLLFKKLNIKVNGILEHKISYETLS